MDLTCTEMEMVIAGLHTYERVAANILHCDKAIIAKIHALRERFEQELSGDKEKEESCH